MQLIYRETLICIYFTSSTKLRHIAAVYWQTSQNQVFFLMGTPPNIALLRVARISFYLTRDIIVRDNCSLQRCHSQREIGISPEDFSGIFRETSTISLIWFRVGQGEITR